MIPNRPVRTLRRMAELLASDDHKTCCSFLFSCAFFSSFSLPQSPTTHSKRNVPSKLTLSLSLSLSSNSRPTNRFNPLIYSFNHSYYYCFIVITTTTKHTTFASSTTITTTTTTLPNRPESIDVPCLPMLTPLPSLALTIQPLSSTLSSLSLLHPLCFLFASLCHTNQPTTTTATLSTKANLPTYLPTHKRTIGVII